MPRITKDERIKHLEAELALAKNKHDATLADFQQAMSGKRLAEGARDSFLDQVERLKERMVRVERENERMRGYIERVQEDDVVREELIRTGDPAGVEDLEPKRKHTSFPSLDCPTLSVGEYRGIDIHDHQRPPSRPIHWVRYGRA
jgi:hypothetical protein